MKLPKELVDKILINFDFKSVVKFGKDFKFIINKKYNDEKFSLEMAVLLGHLEVVKWCNCVLI